MCSSRVLPSAADEGGTTRSKTFLLRYAQGDKPFAIVGRSGSGKAPWWYVTGPIPPQQRAGPGWMSTISDILLPSLCDHQLGVVPQECFYFQNHFENITVSPQIHVGASDQVAKLAKPMHFIQDLPLGFHNTKWVSGALRSPTTQQQIAINSLYSLTRRF